MPFHRCRVCQEDGSTLADEITIMIEEREHEGVKTWYGTITATHTTQLDAGHKYLLILEDGRTGHFSVRRNTYAGGVDRAIAINGIGGLATAE